MKDNSKEILVIFDNRWMKLAINRIHWRRSLLAVTNLRFLLSLFVPVTLLQVSSLCWRQELNICHSEGKWFLFVLDFPPLFMYIYIIIGDVMFIVLGIEPKVSLVQTRLSAMILRAIKIRSRTSFGREVKPTAPCRKILRQVKEPYEYERDTYRQNSVTFPSFSPLRY
jgi:hypothetical protein